MFEKLRDKPLASSQERFETLIGRTTQIYGRLVLVDSVRIDGKVVGNIETSKENKVTVAIGASGEVSGDVTAHRVMVAGKVEGNIYATERVELGGARRYFLWLHRCRARCAFARAGDSKPVGRQQRRRCGQLGHSAGADVQVSLQNWGQIPINSGS